jgi:hypothetical protein
VLFWNTEDAYLRKSSIYIKYTSWSFFDGESAEERFLSR